MRLNNESNLIPVLNDLFAPSEALHLLRDTIDKQINFYRLQNLSKWIGDHSTSPVPYDEKIAELISIKASLSSLINEAKRRQENVSLEIDYKLKIVK